MLYFFWQHLFQLIKELFKLLRLRKIVHHQFQGCVLGVNLVFLADKANIHYSLPFVNALPYALRQKFNGQHQPMLCTL
jgi:hypothetical protein